MRLLICTQAVDLDDPVLGFFHGWIAAFAVQHEAVHVVCLKEGAHTLPANVTVHSLGKESRRSRVRYLARFFRYAWTLRGEYDAVFIHMNEEYVLLGGILWRLLGKRVVLWRNHKVGTWRTRLAVALSHAVCHTSPEAFVARFSKARIMPIGIDTTVFAPGNASPDSILFLGRLDPVKKPEAFLEALRRLVDAGVTVHADVYGDPSPGNGQYAEGLRARYASLPCITFHHAVPNRVTPELYRSHAIYVNLTPAGSFDKTIGEAMASGCVVVVVNTALRGIIHDQFLVGDGLVESVESAVRAALSLAGPERAAYAKAMRRYIEEEHALALVMEKLGDALAGRSVPVLHSSR